MSSLPLIVVLSAGNSKRFKDAGIDTPKGLIKFNYLGQGDNEWTMIEHVLPEENCDYTVVATDPAYHKYFEDNCTMIESTKGQADTLRQACEIITELSGDRPILVLNNDVKIRYPLEVFYEQCKWADVGVLVFESRNTAYSYVDNIPCFGAIYEKARMSNWAVAGAYYFKSTKALAKAVHDQLYEGEPHANGEYYLSGTMTFIEGTKLAVIMEPPQFTNWGTPEDLARCRLVEIEDPKIEAILATMR